LHKYYTYTALHLSELLTKQDFSLESLLGSYASASHRPSLTPAPNNAAKVLVIDCITNFQPRMSPFAFTFPLCQPSRENMAP
jgi:hypothetical protein